MSVSRSVQHHSLRPEHLLEPGPTTFPPEPAGLYQPKGVVGETPSIPFTTTVPAR
jgi:hypothetical protein